MQGKFVGAAQNPVDHDDRDQGDGDDTNVVGELIHNVQRGQAGGGGEQRQGNQRHDHTNAHGRGFTRQIQLVFHHRHHDLQ